MRELGVVQAFGIVLGPLPRPAEKLAELEAKGPVTQELAEERLRLRQQAARDQLRLELAANGRSYTDEQLDEMIGPVQ